MAPSTHKQPKKVEIFIGPLPVCHIALYFFSTNHKSTFEALSVEHFTQKFIETPRSFDLQTHGTLWNLSSEPLTLNSI